MKKEAELRQFPERIVMKFCTMVGLPDVVTRAKLDGDRFGHLCVVGVEFQVFPECDSIIELADETNY